MIATYDRVFVAYNDALEAVRGDLRSVTKEHTAKAELAEAQLNRHVSHKSHTSRASHAPSLTRAEPYTSRASHEPSLTRASHKSHTPLFFRTRHTRTASPPTHTHT